ncbi:hypothetical protein GCM10009118_24870 [Wandonia haliotis]|uniref:Uncharacterized protein n=1 Tax=Wandonia haliotis TaxID=574963 RepID=A0ABP3Y8Y3_9FLAO
MTSTIVIESFGTVNPANTVSEGNTSVRVASLCIFMYGKYSSDGNGPFCVALTSGVHCPYVKVEEQQMAKANNKNVFMWVVFDKFRAINI